MGVGRGVPEVSAGACGPDWRDDSIGYRQADNANAAQNASFVREMYDSHQGPCTPGDELMNHRTSRSIDRLPATTLDGC